MFESSMQEIVPMLALVILIWGVYSFVKFLYKGIREKRKESFFAYRGRIPLEFVTENSGIPGYRIIMRFGAIAVGYGDDPSGAKADMEYYALSHIFHCTTLNDDAQPAIVNVKVEANLKERYYYASGTAVLVSLI